MGPPLFDPLGHPGRDRTGPERAASGPTSNWWVNCVAHAMAQGESRVLLKMGNVLRLRFTDDDRLTVEELP
jgi:hypothetical protein